MAPQARRRRQDPALRPSPHGQRPEEDHRGHRLQEGQAREQARGPGLCLLRATRRRTESSRRSEAEQRPLIPARTCWDYRNSERTETLGSSEWTRKPRLPSHAYGFFDECALPGKIVTGLRSRNWAAAIEKHIKWVKGSCERENGISSKFRDRYTRTRHTMHKDSIA